jgi:hypothetical protein
MGPESPPRSPRSGRELLIGGLAGAVVAVIVTVALLAFPVVDYSQSGYTVTNPCAPNQAGAGCGYQLSFSSVWNAHVSVNLFAAAESTPGTADCAGPGSELYNVTWYTGGAAAYAFVSSGGTTHCVFSPGPTPENVYVTVTIVSPVL